MTSKYSVKIALISTRDSKWLPFGHHWSTTAVCCYTLHTALSRFDFKLLKPFVCLLLNPIRCLKCRSLWLLRPLLTPDAHPQTRASLWSSHHLSATAQRPPSRLISGLFAACRRTHIEGCWLFHGNGRGGRLSLLSFGPQAVLHGYKNSEQQVLNGKVGLRAVQRSPAVMKVNRLACPLTKVP